MDRLNLLVLEIPLRTVGQATRALIERYVKVGQCSYDSLIAVGLRATFGTGFFLFASHRCQSMMPTMAACGK